MILLLVVTAWMLAMLLVVGLCAVASRGDRDQEADARLLVGPVLVDVEVESVGHRAVSGRETTSIAA